MTDVPTMDGLDATVRAEIMAPAVRLRRGGRTLYQLALKADHFGQIVPPVPSRVVQTAQRGYHENHARNIAKFMLDNPDCWAFGPVSLALGSHYMTFQRYQGLSNASVEYGTLTLRPGATESMLILDGQHRRAALQIIRQRQLARRTEAEFDAVQRSIDNADLSVDLYEIDELPDVRRVFNWMNTTKSVTGAERVLLDNTDPFNAAVQRITGSLIGRYESDKIAWLAALCIPLMNNEFRRVPQTITQQSTFWLSATNLRHMLLARTGGRRRLSAADRKRLTTPRIVEDAKKMFNTELPELRPEWQMLRARKIEGMQLPDLRERTLVFDPMIVLTAAWSLYLLHSSPNGRDHFEQLAASWQALDLSVDNPTRLMVLNHRDEPVRPTMDSRFTQQSAQNILDAARDA